MYFTILNAELFPTKMLIIWIINDNVDDGMVFTLL